MVPGPLNAITDVAGVGVGHRTLIEGEGRSCRPRTIRTGVTVVMPHDGDSGRSRVCRAAHAERQRRDDRPRVGPRERHAHHADRDDEHAQRWRGARRADRGRGATPRSDAITWALPVVAETWDGRLNDINGFHVRAEHVVEALARRLSRTGRGGERRRRNGMVSFGFKAGIGTASRVVEAAGRPRLHVGVLVQSNFGRRERFTVDGVPVGRVLTEDGSRSPVEPGRGGLDHRHRRDRRAAPAAPVRAGGAANRPRHRPHRRRRRELQRRPVPVLLDRQSRPDEPTWRRRRCHDARDVDDAHIDGLFHAVIEATEEAILNSMLAAETMTGRGGVTAHELPSGPAARGPPRAGRRSSTANDPPHSTA